MKTWLVPKYSGYANLANHEHNVNRLLIHLRNGCPWYLNDDVTSVQVTPTLEELVRIQAL